MMAHKGSFIASVLLHGLIVAALFVSFEKTLSLSSPIPQEKKPTVDAVVVDNKALKQEVARLDAMEADKKAKEQARVRALKQKELAAQKKRKQEEQLAAKLKKETQALKKESERQLLATQKKLKAQEAKLKEIEKQKASALALKKQAEKEQKALAEAKAQEEREAQKKALAEQKAAEEAAKRLASLRVKQDQINEYAQMMRNKIHQHWRQPMGVDLDGFKCKIAVKLLPTGEVVDAKVIESSGNIEFDRSTELAVHKASPLPMPTEPSAASEFKQFTLTFHPEAV